MSEQRTPAYIGLVAALRATFSPAQLHALDLKLKDDRNSSLGALDILAGAVHDAWDITFDAGESVHPAVREFLRRARRGDSPWPTEAEVRALNAQLCTHGADCGVHPDANAPHNFDNESGARP